MKRIVFTTAVLLLAAFSAMAQNNAKGYYKDVLLDGGIALTSKSFIPSTIYLDLSTQFFLSAKGTKQDPYTKTDTLLQNAIFVGSEHDENGYLLYPDGAPRFRVLYVNGGSSFAHGKSIGEEGRENIRQFILSGGSYVGTCAGSALSSKGVLWDNGYRDEESYFAIWPGVIRRSELGKTYTGMNIPRRSPLLRYYKYGNDLHLDSLYHNLGNHAYKGLDFPAGTEVLATYETDTLHLKRAIAGEPSVWAYKPYENSGREVMCGSHPESIAYGERLHLMSAMLLYAMDGNGYQTVKGELQSGEERVMDRSTHDHDPAFTKIGDKQYHHFLVRVPKKTKTLRIYLKAVPAVSTESVAASADSTAKAASAGTGQPQAPKEPDLFVFARRGKFAYKGESDAQDLSSGIGKVVTINNPKAGNWYISVFCNTIVETEETRYGTVYTGNLEVLNGVPYIIEAEY